MTQQNMSLEMRGVASPYRQINVTSTESTVFLVFCKVQWLNLEGKHIKNHLLMAKNH